MCDRCERIYKTCASEGCGGTVKVPGICRYPDCDCKARIPCASCHLGYCHYHFNRNCPDHLIKAGVRAGPTTAYLTECWKCRSKKV